MRDRLQLPPNDRLRETRRRLPSPSGSGRPMSRQELAEAINAYLWKEHGRNAGIDANYVGKLERGQHRWPGDLYREAFRAILRADSDADLGFYITRTNSAEHNAPVVAVGDKPVGDVHVPVIAQLRAALTDYRSLADTSKCGRPLAAVEAAAAEAHRTYQRADYNAAARMLAALIQDTRVLVLRSSGEQRRRALRTEAVTYIAASKVACKAGDGQLAWLAADRAATAAQLAESTPLSAVAAYQVACGLLSSPDKSSKAESLAVEWAEDLARARRGADAALISAKGSLLLLAALAAAEQHDGQASHHYLAQAAVLADRLGRDDNCLWTAFGPTNVAVHEVSIAVALGQLDRATELGESIDTSRLPLFVVGRRTQVHLDLATAYAQRRGGDAIAVLHLLEAERVAPQAVRVNLAARRLLAALLRRERRAATPGLRSLAQRAGVT